MQMPRNFEVVRKDNGDTYKVYGFSFRGRRAYVLLENNVIIFNDPQMDGNWVNDTWIIQPFTPRKHPKPILVEVHQHGTRSTTTILP